MVVDFLVCGCPSARRITPLEAETSIKTAFPDAARRASAPEGVELAGAAGALERRDAAWSLYVSKAQPAPVAEGRRWPLEQIALVPTTSLSRRVAPRLLKIPSDADVSVAGAVPSETRADHREARQLLD